MQTRFDQTTPILIGGDLLTLALTTIAGFATHNELASAGWRMLTTFLPLCVGWGLLAPWLGLYNNEVTSSRRQLYRPALAAILAAPMAAWLRGLWLNQPILPVFVIVLAAFSALAITLWRGLWLMIRSRQVAHG